MHKPRVTVCVITCNQKNFIERCLLSILDQEASVELCVLIGDDASEDGTSELVEGLAARHPGKIVHLLRSPRMGAFANMRDLIARADGDFIARVDGDDYWLPGKLRKQVAFLQRHPDCAAVYTNAITVDLESKQIGLFNDAGDMRIDLPGLLRSGNFLNNSSVLFRHVGKGAWRETGMQIDYRIHLWHARHGFLAQIGEPLAAYRVQVEGSLVTHFNDRTRELYWEAILSVPRERIGDRDLAAGLADFLRRVTFRAVRTRDASLLHAWVPRVLEASPLSRPRTLWMVAVSILRTTVRLLVLAGKRAILGKRYRILYPH